MSGNDPTPPAQLQATWPFGEVAPIIAMTPNPEASVPPPPQKRRGLIAGLAVAFFAATLASAAAVAYVVADRQNNQTTTTGQTGNASVVPVTAAVTDLGIDFSDEPYARAAAIVAPAVVQIGTTSGVGSGVIYDASGLILTAAHVIEGSSEVTIRLADGNTLIGTVLGSHELSDIGVVKIDTDLALPTASLANGSDIAVGQVAVAVGSPFGLDQTVTAGIVSATDRILRDGPNDVPMVQTDAAINPGNSGGPLVNLAGQVIGINSQIFTESGNNAGVGFAVTIDLARLVADQLVAGEDVRLALLGVSTTSTDDGTPGAFIQEVSPDSAADIGGLTAGDIVVGIDGEIVKSSSDLRAAVLVRAPGSTSTLDVTRNGEPIEITITFGSTE
jgi:S1-C subfamily serine protease